MRIIGDIDAELFGIFVTGLSLRKMLYAAASRRGKRN